MHIRGLPFLHSFYPKIKKQPAAGTNIVSASGHFKPIKGVVLFVSECLNYKSSCVMAAYLV